MKNIQQYLTTVLFLVIISISFQSIGQTPTTSPFETKIDNWVKLYLANFIVDQSNLNGTGQQSATDQVNSASWKKKITLKSKTTIKDKNEKITNLKIYLAFYEFADANSCNSAKDSVLNCFGGDCTKIQWGKDDQTAKTIPCLYIFNEKQIISCHVSCEEKNNYWTLFKPDLEKNFSSQGSKILEADCGGPFMFREK
jgi:hypothetical protein